MKIELDSNDHILAFDRFLDKYENQLTELSIELRVAYDSEKMLESILTMLSHFPKLTSLEIDIPWYMKILTLSSKLKLELRKTKIFNTVESSTVAN